MGIWFQVRFFQNKNLIVISENQIQFGSGGTETSG
jgi:hypothetical protein